MINLVEFNESHIDEINPKFPIKNMKTDLNQAIKDFRFDIATLWHSKENRAIAIAGICHHREGLGELFLIPDKNVSAFKLSFFKTVKALVEYYLYELNMRRLQLTIAEEWKAGKKWARLLGFKEEGYLVGYGPTGGNEYMFGRVP